MVIEDEWLWVIASQLLERLQRRRSSVNYRSSYATVQHRDRSQEASLWLRSQPVHEAPVLRPRRRFCLAPLPSSRCCFLPGAQNMIQCASHRAQPSLDDMPRAKHCRTNEPIFEPSCTTVGLPEVTVVATKGAMVFRARFWPLSERSEQCRGRKEVS